MALNNLFGKKIFEGKKSEQLKMWWGLEPLTFCSLVKIAGIHGKYICTLAYIFDNCLCSTNTWYSLSGFLQNEEDENYSNANIDNYENEYIACMYL